MAQIISIIFAVVGSRVDENEEIGSSDFLDNYEFSISTAFDLSHHGI